MPKFFKYNPPTPEVKLLRDDGFFPDRDILFTGLPEGQRMSAEALRMYLPTNPVLPGQTHAEWCMWHEGILDESLRPFALAFMGTEWVHNKDGLLVTYLYYAGGAWNLGVHWVDHGFHSGFKFALYVE